MRKVCLAASLLVLSIAAVAQGPPSVSNSKVNAPVATITIKVDNLCNSSAGPGTFLAQAWSWGASNSFNRTSTGGGGTGKAVVGDLAVQKKFDECSPALFGAVVSGTHYKTLTLTQEDANNIVVAFVTLSDVVVVSWQIGGSTSDALPMETVSFNFGKICVAETPGGHGVCFDVGSSKTTGS